MRGYIETVLFVWINKHKLKAARIAVDEKKMEQNMSLDVQKKLLGAAR
jgi:hypothetical protein